MSDSQGVGKTEIADPRFIAGVDLIGRTGAEQFQIRYQDDEEPVVWIALACHQQPKRTHWMVGASIGPLGALFDLLDKLMDGGECVHCGRMSAVSHDYSDPTPFDEAICWYIFDPELRTYRRACEGDT